MLLHATDEWNRPRCQQISTYVDADEDYQCAMAAGHDGECDPLPIYPDAEEAARLLAVGIAAFEASSAARPPVVDGWADAYSCVFVGADGDGLDRFRAV
jgi:hypothetical protein